MVYKYLIKPILFLFPPDFVHSTITRVGRIFQSILPLRWLFRKISRYDDAALKQTLLGIDFENPIGLSAGFDKNIELLPLMDSIGFGFVTGGSVTLAKRKGNQKPWFYRLPKTESIVVHAGLANKGLVNIARSIRIGTRKARRTRLILSVAVVARTKKETNQDAIIDAKNTVLYALNNNLARAIEINISCPNAGDNQPFSEPAILDELLNELDKIDRDVPFLVKMPNLNNLNHFDELLQVIVRHNIQAVTVANLVKDRDMVEIRDELPADMSGGLSGSPTRDNSTKLIRYTYRKYGDKLAIIGVGGVFTAEHAYEKIRAGASMIGMVTGLIFGGPSVVGQINREISEMLSRDGFTNITEAVGADVKNS